MQEWAPKTAIVDLNAGNLYSVMQACRATKLNSYITADPQQVLEAEAIILPGVGSFPTAIHALKTSGMYQVLCERISKGIPLMGICLGYQLLMKESHEFGVHVGLGVFDGVVLSLRKSCPDPSIKIPNIGWREISSPEINNGVNPVDLWNGTMLEQVENNSQFYFVHSFYTEIAEVETVLARSKFHEIEYACAAQKGNVFGCQFHPERSGELGLKIYQNFRMTVLKCRNEQQLVST